MASSSNGNGNLMDEFEEAFQACLHALTKQESSTGVSKEETEFEVQSTANKFIDVARQMEAFFLQKRFVISALKPEMLLKEENQELKAEIARKDLLINKHYARLEEWKGLLSDQQQQQGYNKTPQNQQQTDMRAINANSSGIPQNGPPNQMNMVGGAANASAGGAAGGMPGSLQAQLQQQQHLQQQQQQQQHQQHMLQAQQMQQMQQMQVGAQQLYMQQGGPVGARGAFNQGANVLQGPLAYLEKTTSNIDLVGMGDGRR